VLATARRPFVTNPGTSFSSMSTESLKVTSLAFAIRRMMVYVRLLLAGSNLTDLVQPITDVTSTAVACNGGPNPLTTP